MKDTYRERIKEEQKKLSPQQVFFQKAISGFSSILQMKWQGKNWSSCFCTRTLQMGLPAGMTERGLASTLIIQSLAVFWNWNKKSDSLVGILGHECGHARFTDSRLRRVYMQKMQAGTWYPDAPKPENEDEESALAEMNTYLTKKDPAVLSLLTECASYISNLLNDVYIEEKMCSLFPGSIKKGILSTGDVMWNGFLL